MSIYSRLLSYSDGHEHFTTNQILPFYQSPKQTIKLSFQPFMTAISCSG